MDILVKALSLVAIVVVGYAIKRIGWVKTSDFGIFSRIVLKITLPCMLVTAFNDYHLQVHMLGLALVALGVNLVLQVAGRTLERRHGAQAQAFGIINLPSFNMGAFATPYLAGFMGPAAVVNAAPSTTGIYPNRGPEILLEAGIPVVDMCGPEVMRLAEGMPGTV